MTTSPVSFFSIYDDSIEGPFPYPVRVDGFFEHSMLAVSGLFAALAGVLLGFALPLFLLGFLTLAL